MKVSGNKYIFLVLYVDDTLLAANDIDLLIETKQLLFSHFDVKDLGKASYVLGIQILCNRPNGIIRLSQQTYIEPILKMFNGFNRQSYFLLIIFFQRFNRQIMFFQSLFAAHCLFLLLILELFFSSPIPFVLFAIRASPHIYMILKH